MLHHLPRTPCWNIRLMLVNMSRPYAEASTDVSLSFPRSTYLKYCTTRGHLHHRVNIPRRTRETVQHAALVYIGVSSEYTEWRHSVSAGLLHLMVTSGCSAIRRLQRPTLAKASLIEQVHP